MSTDLPTLRAQVEAVQALAAKATPGPWIVHPRTHTSGWGTCVGPAGEMIARMTGGRGSSPKQRAKDAAMLAAAPDLVTHLTDALALAEAQAIASGGLMTEINRLRDVCLLMRESHQHVARQRDEARAELTAIRAALGNGADEAADRISNGEHTPAGHEGPHAEALGAENDGEDDGA